MEKNSTYEKLIGIIDGHKGNLVELCLQIGNIPSPHAHEKKLGDAVLEWLSHHDIKGHLQFITEESVKLENVSGTTAIAMIRISAMPTRSCSTGKIAWSAS